ncbi:MAG: cupin domain-containing protein [Cyanosarcina radialis HA8281-LM2]|jgi:hypothetical protein|nr:cupin domain-containing protein [Cyanosarcina radialis HA8281-LM2]
MKPENFSELAALYALDLLDGDDVRLIEDDILENPELEAELAQFQAAVATIPYSTPLVPVAPTLKNRLFDRIATEKSSPFFKRHKDMEGGEERLSLPFVSISDLTDLAAKASWEPQPIPGVEVAKVHVDADNREIAFFLRAANGVEFPRHQHASQEEIAILEGDLSIDGEPYVSGDRIHSTPGSVHTPTTKAGCLIFVRTSLDDENLPDG